jgi:hypothetical protein
MTIRASLPRERKGAAHEASQLARPRARPCALPRRAARVCAQARYAGRRLTAARSRATSASTAISSFAPSTRRSRPRRRRRPATPPPGFRLRGDPDLRGREAPAGERRRPGRGGRDRLRLAHPHRGARPEARARPPLRLEQRNGAGVRQRPGLGSRVLRGARQVPDRLGAARGPRGRGGDRRRAARRRAFLSRHRRSDLQARETRRLRRGWRGSSSTSTTSTRPSG